MKHALVAAAFVLTACGSESDGGGADKFSGAQTQPTPTPTPAPAAPEAPTSFYVATMQAAPACAPEREGWLIYVAAETALKACTAGNWAPVALPKGDKGDPGAAGKDGTDNRIVASIHCFGALEDTTLQAMYSVSQMASGDVFSHGVIISGLLSVNGSEYFSLQQNGFDEAPVTLTFDQVGDPNGGGFRMTLDRKTLVQTITYDDPDLPAPRSWAKPPSECISNVYVDEPKPEA